MPKTRKFYLAALSKTRWDMGVVWGKVCIGVFYFHIFLQVRLKSSSANKKNGKMCVIAHSTSKRSVFKAILLLILIFFSQFFCFSILLFLFLTELEISFIIPTPTLKTQNPGLPCLLSCAFLWDPRVGKMCP